MKGERGKAVVTLIDLECWNKLAKCHEQKVKVGEGFKLFDDDLKKERSGTVPDDALQACYNDTARQ